MLFDARNILLICYVLLLLIYSFDCKLVHMLEFRLIKIRALKLYVRESIGDMMMVMMFFDQIN